MNTTIIFVILAIIILSIFLFLGLNLGTRDLKKQQQKMLKRKGYQFNKKYYGKGLTPYDVYLDSQKQKLIYFHKGFTIYEYRDLTFLERQKKVTDGKAKYILDYTLKDQNYHIVLKGRIKTSLKVKYEELYSLLRVVDNFNKEQEKIREEERKEKEKLQKSIKAKKKKATKTEDDKSKEKTTREKKSTRGVSKTKATTKASSKEKAVKATSTAKKGNKSTSSKTTKKQK